ncbi:MAG: site-specific integrase [Rhodanobacter sp.]
MVDLQRYLDAATRENTRQSYASAIKHFEEDWGGHLPSHAEGIARYLAAYAERLSINTLRHRLAALARWHQEHGFADPTRGTVVRQAMRGIQAVHPAVEKQATPLQLTELGAVADWLATAAMLAESQQDSTRAKRHLRDRALILLGFWRGLRADELTRFRVEHVDARPGEGLTAFLPRSKTDRGNEGRTLKVPALSRWCPVSAMHDWIAASGRTQGPVFARINRWGTLSDVSLDVDSIVPILRRAFAHAGLTQATQYSGHSLRRGFATWANANGWDVKSLMEYVGWRNVHTAMRYVDAGMAFVKASMEQSVGAHVPAAPSLLPAPASVAPPVVDLAVRFSLTSYASNSRKRAKARQLIEEACLARHRAQREDAEGYRFHIQMADDAQFEEAIATVLDDMYRIADNHACLLEAMISEKHGPRCWE